MPTPGDAFRRVLACLDRIKLPYLVGGSVASSFHGVPRATNDIDMVVALPATDAEEFVKQLGPGFYADPGAIRESIARGRLFNVIDTATTFKIDIHPFRDDAYSRI